MSIKAVSKICDPLDAGKVFNETIMDHLPMMIKEWCAVPYWSKEFNHDKILILMVFEDAE